MADEVRVILGYRRSLVACVLLGLILFMSGCATKSIPNFTQAKNEVKQGGQLVYGSLQEPDTLNPLLSNFEATAEVSSLIFSGLVQTDDKGQWVGDLATDVPSLQNGGVSRDGLTITYRLRSGVTWHDGSPFTAADVKFTWQSIMNYKNNIVSREGYEKIKTIDTPDQYTVVVRFKEYYGNYLSLFHTILPKHILENDSDINKSAFNRAPVGTGPFKLKEWRLAEAVLVEANPNYFRGKPKLDSILYKVIPDNNIMLAQLKNGELDLVSNVAFSQIDQVKSLDGMQTVITPSMVWEHLDFNLDNPLFQDVQVRQAISLGIDKPALIANVLKNVGVPAVGDQSPLSWAYNPALKPEARDVNAARALLVQGGWTLGDDGIFAKDKTRLAFMITFPGGNKPRETVASVIAQQLKDIGIAVEIRAVEPKDFFEKVLKKRDFQMAMYAWVADVDPDNVGFWHSKQIPGPTNAYEGKNYPGWRNAEVDALTEQAAWTIDTEGRKQRYFRIQDLIVQECPIIPLYYRSNIDIVKNTVLNYHPNPTAAGNLWNAWQWGFMVK